MITTQIDIEAAKSKLKQDSVIAHLRHERDHYKLRDESKVGVIKCLTILLLLTTMSISGLLLWFM
ncbi:hypothetical protein [Paraliobacillus sediminis]|uniref:hypothetical protein n=1 Tax=Paraliobacillus sediminis TaxID=1885916 RepID=UPI000E3C7029|nr:hypothetical protein [Paraliobacillus sediminis]